MFAHFDGVGEARGVHSTAITTVFELLRKIRKSVGCSYSYGLWLTRKLRATMLVTD